MPRLSLAKLERHLYSAADRLRQEGLDAATYKDYIFGMLFLKRCSDVFDAEHAKIVGGKVEQGMELKQAEKAYGENPDYYDGFFVPERARWNHLQDKLNDASVPYGSVLDTALGALSEANESLEHVLEQDLIEAVIGLPQNLFYGAGIPACILIMRPNLTGQPPNPNKPADRRGKVLFINADAEFLDTFVAAMTANGGPGGPPLDRFKLAGVIATWWTDTLPDFKTLLENGFPGVMDGWVDAIADAVEDDDNAGPAFDPFGHKLVRRTMTDYLERIATAKADIARLKGEKEAFEQSNAPDDLDEEELAAWNYAKDLERQIRELKADNKDALKELAKLEKQAAKSVGRVPSRGAGACRQNAGSGDPAYNTLRAQLQPVLDQLAAWEAALQPYEAIKQQLAEARARFRTLTAEFVNELKSRCDAMNADQKRALVLELFAQDVQAGLDAAVAEKRQELVRFIEGLWDKYRVTLRDLRGNRAENENRLQSFITALRYT